MVDGTRWAVEHSKVPEDGVGFVSDTGMEIGSVVRMRRAHEADGMRLAVEETSAPALSDADDTVN